MPADEAPSRRPRRRRPRRSRAISVPLAAGPVGDRADHRQQQRATAASPPSPRRARASRGATGMPRTDRSVSAGQRRCPGRGRRRAWRSTVRYGPNSTVPRRRHVRRVRPVVDSTRRAARGDAAPARPARRATGGVGGEGHVDIIVGRGAAVISSATQARRRVGRPQVPRRGAGVRSGGSAGVLEVPRLRLACRPGGPTTGGTSCRAARCAASHWCCAVPKDWMPPQRSVAVPQPWLLVPGVAARFGFAAFEPDLLVVGPVGVGDADRRPEARRRTRGSACRRRSAASARR